MLEATGGDSLAPLLKTYSIEITARDRASRATVIARMPPGSEVFVADLPDQPPEVVREAATELRQGGLEPVPHIVARNIASRNDLHDVLVRLRREARVDRALVTAGDRSGPLGPFASALDLMRSGALQEHGISRLALACYPEGHPRIGKPELEKALRHKVAEALEVGFDVLLISQFAFDAGPVVAFARKLRAMDIRAPLRVGAAGPADRQTLVQFGRDLGAGASLGRLEGPAVGEGIGTPERYLRGIARACERESGLGIVGTHFFPFGSTEDCVRWAEDHRSRSHEGPGK